MTALLEFCSCTSFKRRKRGEERSQCSPSCIVSVIAVSRDDDGSFLGREVVEISFQKALLRGVTTTR